MECELPGICSLHKDNDSRDVASTTVCIVLAYVVLKGIAVGLDYGLYSSKVSRKLSHVVSAPVFVVMFPMFSNAGGARFFAAFVTLFNLMRLYNAGTDEDTSQLNKLLSRSGDKSEILEGPMIYTTLVTEFVLLFWRSSMTGVVASSTMAAGDGMADFVGRRFGENNK